METNEILTNEEVQNATEELATTASENGVGVGMAIGAAVVLVGAAAYKDIARPLAAKIKAKKEAKETAEVKSDCNEVTEDVE